jgi:hypothetical protein
LNASSSVCDSQHHIKNSDAIPFLVVTLGLEKSFILAKSVVAQVSNAKPSEPLRPFIATGVTEIGRSLITDCAFEVAALTLASMSGRDILVPFHPYNFDPNHPLHEQVWVES